MPKTARSTIPKCSSEPAKMCSGITLQHLLSRKIEKDLHAVFNNLKSRILKSLNPILTGDWGSYYGSSQSSLPKQKSKTGFEIQKLIWEFENTLIIFKIRKHNLKIETGVAVPDQNT